MAEDKRPSDDAYRDAVMEENNTIVEHDTMVLHTSEGDGAYVKVWLFVRKAAAIRGGRDADG